MECAFCVASTVSRGFDISCGCGGRQSAFSWFRAWFHPVESCRQPGTSPASAFTPGSQPRRRFPCPGRQPRTAHPHHASVSCLVSPISPNKLLMICVGIYWAISRGTSTTRITSKRSSAMSPGPRQRRKRRSSVCRR